ncbi:hypothetical protein EDD85DRAFT_129544 [Armillaria nabsnona]|nr:hypothetical protein EDD85DRAFT_129544 [Armillaria nabsnona]
MISFLAIFFIPASFTLVEGRFSKVEDPIICQLSMAGIVSVYLPVFSKLFSRGVRLYQLVARRRHRSRIQRQDLSSLEVLAGSALQSVLCRKRNSNRTRAMHIEDPKALLELAGSIKKYQEAQKTYNISIQYTALDWTPSYPDTSWACLPKS